MVNRLAPRHAQVLCRHGHPHAACACPFTQLDRAAESYSVVLSETTARLMFPGEDPSANASSAARRASGSPWSGWQRMHATQAPKKAGGPEYYFVRKSMPDLTWANQEPPLGWRGAVAIVRTPVDPKLAAAALRSLFATLDPTLPVEITTMRERLDQATGRPRFQATLLTVFAAVGLLLAAIWTLRCDVVPGGSTPPRDRRPHGAGATPGSIVALTLAFAARSTAAGLLVGAAALLVMTRCAPSYSKSRRATPGPSPPPPCCWSS